MRQIRRALDRALISFGQGIVTRRLIDALEYRVARFSESVLLLDADPHTTRPAASGLETAEISVRRWFSNRLVSQIALKYIELNERIERSVRRTTDALEELTQVVEFNLKPAEDEPDEPPEGSEETRGEAAEVESALRRTERLLSALIERVEEDTVSLETWVRSETEDLAAGALRPFLEYRVADIRRAAAAGRDLYAPDDARSRLARLLSPLNKAARGAWRRTTPLFDALLDDVRGILSEETRPAQRARVRERLEVEEPRAVRSLSPVYKRLFNPLPLDLPEFYVERASLERDCLGAIAQWGRGLPVSILLFGDRGVGKRTFAHNLIPLKIYDLAPVFQDTPIQTIRLSDEVHDEATLVAQFNSAFDSSAATFAELARTIEAFDGRVIVLVENAVQAYERSGPGAAMCRNFLSLINRTNHKVLWILLLDSPAADLLDTMIDLFDYFSHALAVGPLEPAQIESMIINRHRVSGYDLRFRPAQARPLDRIRAPIATSEAMRHPRRDYFRRLGEVSGGNPLLALLHWMRSMRADPGDDTQMWVEPIVEHGFSLTEALSLPKRLVLALILQHGALTPSEIASLLGASGDVVRIELDHLGRLGFIEILAGTRDHYHVRDVAAVQVTGELRHQNLI